MVSHFRVVNSCIPVDSYTITINILILNYTVAMFLCGIVNQLKVVRVPTNLFSCFVHFKIFTKFSMECMLFVYIHNELHTPFFSM